MGSQWFEVSGSGLKMQAKERGAPRIFVELLAEALGLRLVKAGGPRKGKGRL